MTRVGDVAERKGIAGSSAASGGGVACGMLLYVAAVVLIASRRPDGLLNPQFWAEDGLVWFAQAYNQGPLRALLTPWTGYVQSFSRLVAAASLLVPLRHAPLVFNVAATLAQALVPFFLASSRLASIVPDRRLRLLAALLCIGAPNGFEIQSNVTNVQTHLALLSLLIVLADVAPTRAWATFDVAALLLGGLSGPTCVLLVPVAALAWWWDRRPRRLVLLATLLVPATVQALVFVATGGAGRATSALGATPLRLLQILGGQVFLAGIVGAEGYEILLRRGGVLFPITVLVAGVAGLALTARALWVSRSAPLRLLCLFAALALAAALSGPALDATPRWEGMKLPHVGGRYYAPPIVAWLAVLLWTACADPATRIKQLARVALAAVLLIGMPLDWVVPPRPDLEFARHAARFERRRVGKTIGIPIPPAGWRMHLHKH